MKKLTKEIVNERLSDRGITIIGKYMGFLTKTEFCCSNGHEWITTPNSILSGNGCPVCSRESLKSRLSKDIINERIKHKGITLIGEFKTVQDKTDFQCSNGHIWSAIPKPLFNNAGCPHCAGVYKSSKDNVNSRLSDRGITIIGDYISARTKTEFCCSNGHEWTTTPNAILSGNGCPYCATHGFSPNKPGWIYIIMFADYIKYGITNNLDSRLNSHRRNGDYRVSLSTLYEDGNMARVWENNVKSKFGGRFVTKEIMPDGYTETLCISRLDELLVYTESI